MKSLMLGALHIVWEGTLCPNETYDGLRSFSGPEFEAYLRRTSEEIIDRAVRMVKMWNAIFSKRRCRV